MESQTAMMVANPKPEGLERLYEAVQTGQHRCSSLFLFSSLALVVRIDVF